jgi:Arc/MetJ-type ribon-helix-helix transcriptional regulator
MNLNLPTDQQKWLEAQVASGRFATIEAAAEAAIVAAMIDNARIEADDFDWAKPYVDKGRDDALRGDVLTHAEHKARMAARLEALRR